VDKLVEAPAKGYPNLVLIAPLIAFRMAIEGWKRIFQLDSRPPVWHPSEKVTQAINETITS